MRIVAWVVLLALPAALRAADWSVPVPIPTIQQAINNAAGGDVILVSAGLYKENIDFLGKGVHIKAVDGADVTIIDGQGLGTVVTMANGEPPEAVLIGFTIVNGHGLEGGGVWLDSDGEVASCQIRNCNASRGGGIAITGGQPNVHDSSISWNGAQVGGGLYITVDVNLNGLTISHNIASSGSGGGVRIDQSVVEMTGCVIDSNTAQGSSAGGGIATIQAGLRLQDVTLLNNQAKDGGGFWCYRGWLTANNSHLLDNTAIGSGGGGMAHYTVVNWTDGTIADSHATTGAGLYLQETSLQMDNCQIERNTATQLGGGLMAIDLALNASIENTAFTQNEAESGGGAMVVGASLLALTDLAFTGNHATGDGGGLVLQSVTLSESHRVGMIDNDAMGAGGGLFMRETFGQLFAWTAGQNTALMEGGFGYQDGGVIYFFGAQWQWNQGLQGGGYALINGDLSVAGSWIRENTAAGGGGAILNLGNPVGLQTTVICSNTLPQIIGPFDDIFGNTILDICLDCTGDADGDQAVDIDDLLAVVADWGPCAGCPADFNGDGVVNVADLLTVLDNWGWCS